MRILLIGSGGREHALAWKISQSPRCSELFIAPGNAGTQQCGQNVPLDILDFQSLGQFCLERQIDMLVVGPEAPLVAGVVDHFKKDPALQHIYCIGPSKEGAQLEGSKAYAKEFMARHQIPTAAYKRFDQGSLDEGLAYLAEHPMPVVLKADGLAAGKGVVICQSSEEAQQELRDMLEGKFGQASSNVVIEEFLSGIELSIFALSDGKNYRLLPSSKDYKRVGEGDSGPNTGGMGSISPVPFAEGEFLQKIEDRVIRPTVEGLASENIEYRGFIYFGLIRVDGDPFVIEYNCRMGDPETQVVMPLLDEDLVELFEQIGKKELGTEALALNPNQAVTVVVASEGYPGSYQKGIPIKGLEKIEDSIVFHAGTKKDGDDIVSSGGRVLAVTSLASTRKEALKKSYQSISKLDFEGSFSRQDIGFDFE
jgi:phosphoribosylamine--glycine ligase